MQTVWLLVLHAEVWFDSRSRAVLQVRAERAWLPSMKFRAWELEAHCELKVTFKKK